MNLIDEAIGKSNKMTNGNPLLNDYYYKLCEIFLRNNPSFLKQKDIKNIFDFFIEMGKYNVEKFKNDEIQTKYVLSSHLIYVRVMFFKLFYSFVFMDEEYPDFYSRVVEEIGEVRFYQYFLLWGHNCLFEAPKEIKNRIFYHWDYLLYWNEFYRFVNVHKPPEIMINDLIKDGKYTVDKQGSKLIIQNFKEKKKEIKKRGRPSVLTWEMVEFFSQKMEEARKRGKGKFRLSDIWNLFKKKYSDVDSTTLRNFLRNYMPLLEEKRKSIKELTKEDIRKLWNSKINLY